MHLTLAGLHANRHQITSRQINARLQIKQAARAAEEQRRQPLT